MSRTERVTEAITSHGKLAIAAMLVLTVVMGSGAGMIEQSSSLDQFQSESEASAKLDYINKNFSTGPENQTSVQVIIRGENVLDKRALVSMLQLERAFRNNESINQTLAENNSMIGVPNLVATAAIRGEQARQMQANATESQRLNQTGMQQRAALENASSPTLEEQIDQLESMNATEIDRTVSTVLTANTSGSMSALTFMPTSYEPGNTTANATMLIVTQESGGGGMETGGMTSGPVVDAQLAMQDIAAEQTSQSGLNAIVFGSGMISEEISNSMADSLLIVGPLALLFVVLALIIAYRDLIDILLGLFGIGAVLVWTFGFMGWTGIDFNQMFIAVPVLLIGLSIDYAIHIFMRHREERQKLQNGIRGSMKVALAGVGVALVWVTATTAIGFLSNLTSPVPPIQDFGVVSAVGITAALLIFGILVPALKVEIDGFLEARGWDREKQAFGTGGGRFSKILAIGSTAAQKAPFVVILLAVLVSAGGAYGATQVDTSFNQEDFLAEDPSGWMEELPEPFKPSEYTAKQHLTYVNENFLRQDSQAQILIQEDITEPDTLEIVANASEQAARSPVTKELAGGGARIQSPLSVMEQVAAQNESFNATFVAADTDGDGIPDRNLEQVYDKLYAVAEDQAAGVIHRTEGGDYQALRMVVSTSGTASGSEVTSEMRAIADGIDANSGLEATATGQTILFTIVQDQLLQTVIESLLITLVAVFAFLMLTYRITEGSATLGAVTLLPVVFSVAWILGTMWLLDIPFNILTGMITSLTVGLGVAYSIHLSERYNQELERTESMWTAMNRAVTGTGGALLGSAATTVGGFGVLVFAILPPLQQFGIITGMTIIYAFLASVLVLPSLLVLWTRYVSSHDVDIVKGPDDDATPPAVGDAEAAGSETPADSNRAAREFGRDVAAPGEGVTVTVRIDSDHDRIVLRERAGCEIAIVESSPEPVDVAVNDGALYAAWDEPDPVVRYTATIPANATDGQQLSFEGEVLVHGDTVPVWGEESVEIVTDVFERITATGTVSQSDLRNAYDRFEEGTLSQSQLERVHRAWLRVDASPEHERLADD